MKRVGSLLLILVAITALVLVDQPGWYTDLRGNNAAPSSTLTQSPLRALVVLPDDGPASILDEIDAARTSIDLYVYLLPSEDILAALGRAQARDVHLRVILERDPFGGGNSNQESFDRLKAMGASVKWAPDQFQFSHIKMFVVDSQTAVIMTLNLSYSALNLNREFAVVTTEQADVEGASRVFQADWDGDPVSLGPPFVVSPESSRREITDLIDQARTSIDVFAEVVRDTQARAALIAAAQRGVVVRVLVPDRPADDDATIYRALIGGGVQIRLLADLYSHAKAIIVDGTTAFVGSQNLTAISLDDNRELGMMLTEPANLARLEGTFASDWADSADFAKQADVRMVRAPACQCVTNIYAAGRSTKA
jgi:cardiolipin synthase A/B